MSMHIAYHLTRGSSPLIVSIPHAGIWLPDEVIPAMTDSALELQDTDWHVPRLYDFVRGKDVSVLEARCSRYYIDLNRSKVGKSLYPGKSETELCPLQTFSNQNIYKEGREPDEAEIASRIRQIWQPYHDALASELQHIKSRFGYALLWDAHSIRSRVPRFFSGQLADFNLGTGAGTSCPADIANKLMDLITNFPAYSAVLNGRFKGGFITRNYGNPQAGIVAVQLELSQITYMDEVGFSYDESRSQTVIKVIETLIDAMLQFELAD